MNSLEAIYLFIQRNKNCSREEFIKRLNEYEHLCLFTTEFLLLTQEDKVRYLKSYMRRPNGVYLVDYLIYSFKNREDIKNLIKKQEIIENGKII